MSSDLFSIVGTYSTSPQGAGSSSGLPALQAPINEKLTLGNWTVSRVSLTADAPVAVDFGGLTNAHAIVIKTIGGKVAVAITSADGAAQVVPVDTMFVLISSTVPVTAMTLTRVAGTTTTVEVFIGEKAA